MPFARPTPEQIRDRLAAELEAAIPGADAGLRHTVEGVLMRMMALVEHELHGHLAWIARQVLPDQADDEWLARHARIWGLRRRSAASARGSLALTGAAGTYVPEATAWRRADGLIYHAITAVTLAEGTAVAEVIAAEPGAVGNAAAGEAVSLVAPVAGLDSAASFATDAVDGVDVEADDALRERLLDRIRQPAHGGAVGDYLMWAREVPGVDRVWVVQDYGGDSTVGIGFTVTPEAGGPLPSPTQIQAVVDHLELVRPVTAMVLVFAPTLSALDMSIDLAAEAGVDVATVRVAVTAALDDYLRREADMGGTVYRSRLSAVVSSVSGVSHFEISAPGASVTYDAWELPVLGTVTWL